MACCALAAFLISQIIFGLDWLRERLGVTGPAQAANPATVWRLGAVTVAAPPRRRSFARLELAVAGGSLTFALTAALTLYLRADPQRWAAVSWICTGHGLERLASLRGG